MITIDGKWLEEREGQAKEAFERANPDFWNMVQGDPSKIALTKRIDERVKSIRLRMQTHIHKHRQKWISREAVKVFEERNQSALEHPRPSWVNDLPGNVSYLEESRRRVQSRIQQRMQRINAAGERVQTRLIEDQKTPKLVPELQSEVLKIVERTQEMRKTANRHFNMHRDRWMSHARDRGSDNPEQGIYARHRQRMDRINNAEHNLIHCVFKGHGQSLPEQKEHIFARAFNQALV